MFGYLLVSNTNQVLYYGGNSSFDTYIHNRLCAEGLFSPDSPSTSSGIYSDSSSESLCSRDEQQSFTGSPETGKSANQKISLLFLPIIAKFRSYNGRNDDIVTSIISDEVAVLLKQLKYDYLLITIGNSEKQQHQFMEYVELGLDVNAGPLLPLIDSKIGSDLLADFLESLGHSMLENKKVKVFLDVRKALFYKTELAYTVPILSTLVRQLDHALGPNRLLLARRSSLLCSVASNDNEKLALRHILASEVNFLLQQISTMEHLSRGKIFQAWLRSKKSIIPYYVNVIICNTAGGLTLISLSEAKYSPLIRAIATFLLQLDRIQNSEDIIGAIHYMGMTVETISRHFLALAASNTSSRLNNGEGFVRSPEQTASFVRTIWRRTEALLQNSEGQEPTDYRGRSRSNMSISLSSLRSAFSTLSLPSIVSRDSALKREKLSARCEVMVGYVHRQAINILHELCSESHGAASAFKLEQFLEISSRVFDESQKALTERHCPDSVLWIDSNEAIKKEVLYDGFLRPTSLGLEMVAYAVSIPSRAISISFTPDWVRKELDTTSKVPPSWSCITITGKSGALYKFYRIRSEEKDPKSGISIIKQLRGENHVVSYAVALFHEGIHQQLAQRQVKRLLALITSQMLPLCSQIG